MRYKLIIYVLAIFLYSTSQAYAVFDILAFLQSKLELVTEVKDKVTETLKKAREIQKRAIQGFEAASSCFSNPTKCDVNAVMHFAGSVASAVENRITAVRVMTGADDLSGGDLQNKSDDSLAAVVEDAYIYEYGAGDDISNLNAMNQEMNGIIADDVAILFAKAVSSKQAIIQEDGSLYQSDFEEDNVDEVLKAQSVVEIATQQRLNRILEMRAYMNSASLTLNISEQINDSNVESGD